MAESPTYQPIEVYLTVSGGLEAITFYEQAFGATEAFHQMADDGARVLHATLKVFGTQIMLSDQFPEVGTGVTAPPSLGGTTVTLHVNLASPAEVDRVMARASDAGATITMAPSDTFWGMRYGQLKDPFGHAWSFGAALPDAQGAAP